MSMFGWLDRFAARLNKKIEPTAVAGAAANAPATAVPAAVVEIEEEEAAELEKQE